MSSLYSLIAAPINKELRQLLRRCILHKWTHFDIPAVWGENLSEPMARVKWVGEAGFKSKELRICAKCGFADAYTQTERGSKTWRWVRIGQFTPPLIARINKKRR